MRVVYLTCICNLNAARHLLKNLMRCWHSNRKHAIWLFDEDARSPRNAPVTFWIKQKNIQRWPQSAHSTYLSKFVVTKFFML